MRLEIKTGIDEFKDIQDSRHLFSDVRIEDWGSSFYKNSY